MLSYIKKGGLFCSWLEMLKGVTPASVTNMSFMTDDITMVGQELKEVQVLGLLLTLMDSYA